MSILAVKFIRINVIVNANEFSVTAMPEVTSQVFHLQMCTNLVAACSLYNMLSPLVTTQKSWIANQSQQIILNERLFSAFV